MGYIGFLGIGVALLRLIGNDFVALIIESNAIYLREWDNKTLLGELASADVTSEEDAWYVVKVAYSGTNNTTLTVSRARSGDPFEELFSETVSLAENASQDIGFGVGENGDYAFREVVFKTGSDTAETAEATYQYDALGRRIAKTIDPDGTPATTEFYYAGPHVIEERNGAGAVQATYVYGAGLDELLSMNRASTDYFYHSDDLGNIMAVTNGSGAVQERYEYDGYGAVSMFNGAGSSIGATSIGNDYLFNARRGDPETGLYYYRTRYMDPAVGRFITRDTIGLYGDSNNLGNGQAYVGNNPWTNTDPYGEGVLTWMLMGNYNASDWAAVSGGVSSMPYNAVMGVKGMVYTGPKNIVVGLAGVIAHPIQTATGVRDFAVTTYEDPYGTASAIGSSIAEGATNPESIGAFASNIIVDVGTAGASKAAYARYGAKIAEVGGAANDVGRVAGAAVTARRGVQQLPQDAAVKARAPNRLKLERPISKSPTQNAFKDDLVNQLKFLDAEDIRVNQQQVNAAGRRVGINRPDIQWTLDNKRYYLELETPGSRRGPGHIDRIKANDPSGVAQHYKVP
jgi:RHS repeat-associated protein